MERGGGHQPEAVTKTTTTPAKKQTNNQGEGTTAGQSGSRFDILTNLEEEPDCTGQDATRTAAVTNQIYVHSATSKSGPNHSLWQSTGKDKLKGKEKMSTLNTATSNENILKDIRPLGQNQTAPTKVGANQPVNLKTGLVQPLSAITNLMGRSPNQTAVLQHAHNTSDIVQNKAQYYGKETDSGIGSGTGCAGPNL